MARLRMPSDPRRVYILRVASHILSLNLVEERLPNPAALTAFCDGRATLLVVTRLDQKGRVDVSNELKESSNALFRVIIYKTDPVAPLSMDNYKSEVNVITAHRSVDQALLSSLHQVFAKAVSEKSNSSKLNVLVRQLEAEWSGSGGETAFTDDTPQEKMSIEAEQRFWARQASVTASDADGSAATYAEVLRLLSEKLTETENISDTEDILFELLDVAEEALDTVWNTESGDDAALSGSGSRYTQGPARLAAMCAKRVARLGASIWSATDVEYGMVYTLLQTVSTVLTEWRECVRYLTTEAWPQNTLNEWRGPPLGSLFSEYDTVEQKIQKISSIRCFADDLAALAASSTSTKTELFASIQSIMQEMNPCVEGDTDQQWSVRCAAIDRLFEGHVDALVPRLSAHLQNAVSENVDTILVTLKRYERFLSQRSVLSKLRAERENVVSALISDLPSATVDRALIIQNHGGGKFLTEIASQIIAVRSCLVQMENLRQLSVIFADISKCVQLNELIADRMSALKSAENEHFNKWCREMMVYANASDADATDPSRSVVLRTTGRLMMLDREHSRLTVSYGDRLALLLNEVRQLHALGFQIPSKILQCVRAGERFYRYGVVLKQVAQFYNTIEHQMLPCQQAMMLDEALAFERLIIPPSASTPRGRAVANVTTETYNVTWENPDQLSTYIDKLQAAADRLINHNRRLRQTHSEIGVMVNELLEIDLVRDADRWAERLLAIRQHFAEEQRHVGAAANARAWTLHWDRQLYKVLQVQFRWALESLSEQMPLLHTQLVLRDKALQLRPPLEEIKLTYYKELNKFLLIPQNFTGIQPNSDKNSELYASILSRNTDSIHALYEESERIFDELNDVGFKFREWTSLWSVNFEELIEQHFKRAADWEAQYRHLKRKRREADTIPNQISIGCVRISMHSFKASVDDSLKRVNDALVWTLRHSAVDQLQDIERSLNESIEKLSNLPQNLDEIADANQTHLALLKLSKKIRQQLETIEEKFEVLRDVFHTPDKIGDSQQQQQQNTAALSTAREQFTRFEALLNGHEAVMRDQVELMKQNVAGRVSKLAEDCERHYALWNQFKPREELSGADGTAGGRGTMLKAVEFVREKRQHFARLCEQRERIRTDCEQLELDVPDFSFLDRWQVELDEYEVNYLLYEDFGNELQTLADQEWILFRNKIYLFDEFLQSWLDKLNAKDYVKTAVSVRLQKDIEAMKEFSSCLRFCRGEVLSAEHWLEMFRTLKLPRGTTLETLKFGDLLNVQTAIVSSVEKLKDLNARAHGEVTIREAIQELELWAAQAEFSLADYRHSNGSQMRIVREWKNVIAQVKDNQALLQSLKSSPYYKQFKDQTAIWEKRIVDLDMCLHLLNDIQRKWVYLEPIFGRGALPTEAARFNRVDVEMRVILDDISKDPRIVALCSQQSLARTLEQIADQLARCQRALNDFLEEKRRAFPRFYFLGDDDLLEILGQSTNPTVIQSHLKKLFQGVDRVVFDTTRENIRAVISAEGERVVLDRPVRIVPQVETWLHQLSHELRNTLRRLIAECVQTQALDPQKYPSQVLCVSEQIRFCSDAEQCFSGGPPSGIVSRLRTYSDQLRSQLDEFHRMRVEDHVLRLKLKSLILDLVHHIDVVRQLLEAQSKDTLNCWTWQRQLRFYLVSGEVVARQAGAEIPYTYEYQGNTGNLVHTPLTDKCYLTLTQALSMGLGGNPYGPAGTGKTESVKALARLLGRQVLVFNCDEGIDVLSIGRIFVGIVQCGAWGCFDEFNRLEKNVLSAVSGQIQTIQDAIRCRATDCRLNGAVDQRPVIVDANAALFVTMNPAGKGYGGRQQLPDNLKQLFRPVLMSAPDNELIAEILLYSDGFKTAKTLAQKLVTAFNLSKDMLSTQQHYDWGLRAIKTVLCGCADAIVEARIKADGLTPERECEILLEKIQLNTMSKLTFVDAQRFCALLSDIFPRACEAITHSTELGEFIRQAADKIKLKLTDRQMSKIFQLHEQLRQRIGVVMVGACGVGKTTVWRVLADALALAGQPVRVYTLNPKCMPRNRLLGSMDVDTREFSDGVLTSIAREVSKQSNEKNANSWIVCDGDIDPEWIEALNSVLDDNKLLTIPSGERIQFGSNVNFIFETCDLVHASPATVSRMGMIYMSIEDFDFVQLVGVFVDKYGSQFSADFTAKWLPDILFPALKWTFEHPAKTPNCSRVSVLHNVISHIQTTKSLNQFRVAVFRGLWPHVAADSRAVLAKQIIFNAVSIVESATLDGASNSADQSSLISNIYCDPRTDSLVFFSGDCGVSTSEHFGQNYTSVANVAPPLVQTARIQSARDTIRSWLNIDQSQWSLAGYGAKGRLALNVKEDGVPGTKRRHFIVYGEDGCGKEQLLRHCFSADRHSTVATLHCSAQTSKTPSLRRKSSLGLSAVEIGRLDLFPPGSNKPNTLHRRNAEHIEHLLAERCAQTTSGLGRVLRPRDTDNLIVYLKSPNLIRPDRYGTSSLIAFLQQIFYYGGFYDSHLDWIGVENVQIVISVSDVRHAERFALPARFISQLCCLSIECPDDAELTTIYTSYLSEILSRQNSTQRLSAVETLAALMVRTFARIRAAFQGDGNAANLLHYTFTPLDLTNWVCSLTRHQLSEMDAATLHRCVVYEASRIFRDRLVSAEHCVIFDAIILETFGIAASTPSTEWAFAPISGVDAMQLVQLSRQDYRTQLERAVTRFEFEISNFNLTLDDELVDLCLALDRALTASSGSVLMAGRSAMGHDVAVRLMAHIHSIRVETLHVSGSYAMKHFVAELKAVMKLAGVDDERVVLLVEDYQLVDNTFLQYLNAVIASGSMPGLYTQQEFDQHVAALRNAATSDPLAFDGSGGDGGNPTINFNAYFAKRVKRNLHVVVVMDVTEKCFCSRITANPSLYKHCTVFWRDKWSTSTLTQIADLSLRKRGIITDETAASKAAALGTLFAELFQSAPSDDASGQHNPAQFVVFLQNFFGILERKRSGVQERLKRLKAGVDKLTETRAAVSKMQKKAAKKSKILAEKQAEADQALNEITRSMTGANEQRAGMEDLRAATEKKNEHIERQKRLIDEQLQEVEPLLKEAREAVGSIKADSLSEIRSLRAPPDAIRDILQAVLLFMGILDISWEAMRRFLAKSGVKDEIINFDARQIKPETAKRVQALISSKSASFDPKNAKRASAAAAPLAAWVNANLQYSRILEKIAPLENERITLTKNLESAQSEMSNLSAGLDTLGQRVARLKQNFETLMKDATQIKVDLSREQATIEVAGTLVDRLKGEFDRWQDQIVVLERELSEMEICCLISAAFVTFLGSAGQETREVTLDKWFRIVNTTTSHLTEGDETWSVTRFRVLGFLASESDQIQWKERGVADTNTVLENVAVMLNHHQSAFVIDPSGRVTQFLVNFYRRGVTPAGQSVEVLSAEQADLLTQIELGARFGKTLIVTDATARRGVEPALIPLLRRDYSSRGGRRAAVQIGAKSVDVDEANFRLFFCSRDEQLFLPEHVRSTVDLVNFATTRSALSSQILGIVMRIRQPELERRSVQLTAETEAMCAQLLESEQQLLNELANSEGSLLENTELLASLNTSKENSERIHHSLAESQLIQRQIEEQRDAYRTFAQKCAELYFAVADFYVLNPLYNFNVDELLRLLRKLFRRLQEKNVGGASNLSADLERIYETLRLHMFEFVSRAIFKADRLMFGMRYIHAISSSAEVGGRGSVRAAAFQKNEWEFFLGQLHIQEDPSAHKSSIQWLEESRQSDVVRLQAHLPTLYSTLNLEDASTWNEFLRVVECECAIPSSVAQRLSAFQQVLVVQALRPDRLHSAMSKFVSETLGIKSLSDASTLDWHAVCAEMDDDDRVIGAEEEPGTQALMRPVLVLIGVGSTDPSQELADVAAQRFGEVGHFYAMAMSGSSGGVGGFGATTKAVVDTIRRCATAGDWLCLNNIHLAADLAPIIRQELSALSAAHSRGFRLWLMAEAEADGSSINSLPPTFIQNCIKLAYEAPPGIRSNVQRSLRQWVGSASEVDGLFSSAVTLRALVVLCWLHAVLQERRTFIPQGWLKFYEFCASDLRAAKHALEMLAGTSTRSIGFSWEAFRGLMASTIYGGRIEYDLDVRVLRAYLRQYFGDDFARQLSTDKPLQLPGAGIHLPNLTTLKDYLRWTDSSDGDGLLAQLSAGDDGDQLSALLGMPPNVAFGWELAQSAETIVKLRRIISAVGVSASSTMVSGATPALRDTWSRLLTPLLNHWKRLNKQRPPNRPPADGSANDVAANDSFLEALRLERLFGNELVQRIHTSLSAISRVVRGSAVQPDDKCSALARQLIAHQVPLEWTSIWPSPRDDYQPTDYLSAVMTKMTQISELIDKSIHRKSPPFFDTNSTLSAAYLFRPILLFNAFRQHSARRQKVGVDALRLSCRWSDASQSTTTGVDGSILLIDLHVQGARLSGGELRGVDAARAASFTAAPPLCVMWTTEQCTENASTVQIPIFADAQRTAFVINVDVACTPQERDAWTIAGVALFTF